MIIFKKLGINKNIDGDETIFHSDTNNIVSLNTY